MNSEKW